MSTQATSRMTSKHQATIPAPVRKALGLKAGDAVAFDIGHSVMAMITSRGSSLWPLDVPIQDGKAAALNAASIVRMKLFTLDNRLILRKAGTLAKRDANAVGQILKKLFGRSL